MRAHSATAAGVPDPPQRQQQPDIAWNLGWRYHCPPPLPGALTEFLDAGEPPVFIGFGSMAGSDPVATTAPVLAAARRAGARVVLGTGWGGLATDTAAGDVFVVDDLAYEQQFPRVAAVIHHGGAGAGAGTVAAAAGRPQVVCPFVADQPFWGRRMHQLGVATGYRGVVGADVLYDDGRVMLDRDGITLCRYYFPFGTSKRIPYGRIRRVWAQPMGWLTGKGRGWGTAHPGYWLPLDLRRPRKNILVVLDLGGPVKPAFTPDDPDRVLEILGAHAHVD